MQLVCPDCRTAFYVDPGALGRAGRNVRCTKCSHTWFATPAALEPEAVSESVVEPAVAGGSPVEATPAAAPPQLVLPDTGNWDDTVLVDVETAPSIAPGRDQDASAALSSASALHHAPAAARPSHRRSSSSSREHTRLRLFALNLMLAAIVIVAINARESMVRMLPQLASLYATIGLPVNLRGLEFEGVRILYEAQDGVAVLVVEGEVVNITRQPLELPRLRLAMRSADGRELYSWTALLPLSALADGERVSFRSRLASPPEEGHEVLVRFLHRSDFVSR